MEKRTLYKVTIPGRPGILKNGKRIFRRGKKIIVLPKQKYASWEQSAILVCRAAMAGDTIRSRCEMIIRFYAKNLQHEADLSNMLQGPEDVLQKAGVIENDKLITRIRAEKFFDGEPRVEIELVDY